MAYFARSYFGQVEPEGREELRKTLSTQPKDDIWQCSPAHDSELGHHYGLLDVPWPFKDEICEDDFGGFLTMSSHYDEFLLDFAGGSYGLWDSELSPLLDNENVRFVRTRSGPPMILAVSVRHEDGRTAQDDPSISEPALYSWPLLPPQFPTVVDIFDLLPPGATAFEEADEHSFFNYLRNLGIVVNDLACFELQFDGDKEEQSVSQPRATDGRRNVENQRENTLMYVKEEGSIDIV